METKPVYDVTVDEAGLNWEQAGPLFDRYAVDLTGRIDRRWADCYQRITVSAPAFSRFHLDPGASSVTFTCRSSDGPVEVMGVLRRLEELLVRVNREASAEANVRPVGTSVQDRPMSAAASAQARPTSTSTSASASAASGLLSRLTRH
jgi:hypothetical protein